VVINHQFQTTTFNSDAQTYGHKACALSFPLFGLGKTIKWFCLSWITWVNLLLYLGALVYIYPCGIFVQI